MSTRLVWAPCLAALLLASGPARAAAPPPLRLKPATPQEVKALADKIDRLITERWNTLKLKPAPLADDAEFLRRAYLDLAGRIPTVAEAREFLADRRVDKRALLVDRLLDGPRYVVHLTNVWRALLIPEAGNNFQVRLGQPGF